MLLIGIPIAVSARRPEVSRCRRLPVTVTRLAAKSEPLLLFFRAYRVGRQCAQSLDIHLSPLAEPGQRLRITPRDVTHVQRTGVCKTNGVPVCLETASHDPVSTVYRELPGCLDFGTVFSWLE